MYLTKSLLSAVLADNFESYLKILLFRTFSMCQSLECSLTDKVRIYIPNYFPFAIIISVLVRHPSIQSVQVKNTLTNKGLSFLT